MKQGARSSSEQGRVFEFFMFSQVLERADFKEMPPSTRPTDRPSIHPSASCLFLQPSGGGRRTAAAAPSSNPPAPALQPRSVARSLGRSGHWPIRDFSCAPLAAKRRRKEGALLTHASPAPHVRSSIPPSLPPSLLPLRSLWGRRPPHNTARLKPYSALSLRRLLGRPDAEASSSSPPPALPPSGSANMAQTDELVLAFAFASASKWGSEIDAEEEGGSLRGCLAGCLTPRLFMYTRGGTSE